jgi:PAS domain S-box-containing protein
MNKENIHNQDEEAVRRLAAIIESSDDAIIGKTTDGVITSWNAGAEKLYGYSADDAVGKSITILASPDQPDDIAHVLRRVYAGEVVHHYETKRMTKDGRTIDVSLTVSPIRDNAGAIIGISTIAHDIAELKQAERQLQEYRQHLEELVTERTAELQTSQRMLQIVIDNFPGLVFWKDTDLVYLGCNAGYASAAGLSDASQVIGKTDYDMPWKPEEIEAYRKDDQHVMDVGQPRMGIIESLHAADGEVVWFDTSKIPLKDASGKVIGILGASHDITQIKNAEAELTKLNQTLKLHATQLEEAYKELEAFSYSVSHDLRAPLRHVQGYADMLVRHTEGQLSDKALRYLKTITAASSEMGQLIDDLLAFSKMSRSEIQLGKVQMTELVKDTRKALASSTVGRDVNWTIGALPEVIGDAALLKLALTNLLNNAVKYTRKREKAEIEVGCSETKNGQAVFFVRDNGVGFDMKYVDKLFGVFQRLHSPDEYEGNGIGLATVRRIISRHGGKTWAEGEVDRGATFYFTLPVAPSHQN